MAGKQMESRKLGRMGLDVPVVGMGTWKTFDVTEPAEVTQRRTVVDAALEGGTALFDSSPMYGAAERVLSAALTGRRTRALVATKVWAADDHVAEAQIQQALAYYDGRIDLYQIHNLVAWPQRLVRLERLRDEDLIGFVGLTCGRNGFPQLMEIMRSGRVSSVQVPYNPQERLVEQEVLPLRRPRHRRAYHAPARVGGADRNRSHGRKALAACALWRAYLGTGAAQVAAE